MWYFSGKVQTTGWWMQAWLITRSSRSPWHLGSIPLAQGRGLSPRATDPVAQHTLIPRFYCLLSHRWLSFVRKHNSSGQSLPAACAPSQRHTVHNPLYSPARSHSQVRWLSSTGSERERAWVTTRMVAFREENNRARSLWLPVAHSDNSQRSHEKQSSVAGLFL